MLAEPLVAFTLSVVVGAVEVATRFRLERNYGTCLRVLLHLDQKAADLVV
jgi:hypothetical protein